MKTTNNRRHKSGGLTPTLIFSVFVTCFGSSMLYGYNLSVLNLPGEEIKCFLNKSILGLPCTKDYANSLNMTSSADSLLRSTNKIQPSKDVQEKSSSIDADFLYAQVNSVFVIAGAIGAFATGWISDFFGRRNGLMVNSITAIIGGIICGPTVVTYIPYLLYVGRFFIGLNCGVTIGLASMYLIELSPSPYRGAIAACHQLAVTIGIVVGNILTLTFTLNSATCWPIAQALTAVPAAIGLFMLPFCPESPRYLFLKREQRVAATEAFKKVNQTDDINEFVNELENELQASKGKPKFRISKLFTQSDLRMPLLIACLIQIFQQLSGINAVVGYSGTLLKTAGVSESNLQFCVVGVNMWNVLCTIIALPLLERAGRRTLLLVPSAILAGSLVLLTITITLTTNGQAYVNTQVLSVISVVGTFIYIFGFALGLGPIPGFIVAEVTRQETRAAAYSISQAIQWLCTLMVMASYPSLNKSIGGYVFLLYLFIVVSCWIFFYLFMPETRGKTFDEIATILAFAKVQVGNNTQSMVLQGNGSMETDIPLVKKNKLLQLDAENMDSNPGCSTDCIA